MKIEFNEKELQYIMDVLVLRLMDMGEVYEDEESDDFKNECNTIKSLMDNIRNQYQKATELKPYMVLYRQKDEALIDPWGYKVMAENLDHAEEQFYNAEPESEILWVVETENYNEALDDYYGELNG
jgi:hypothetical protein